MESEENGKVPAGAEGAKRATGVPAGSRSADPEDRGWWSSGQKLAVVLRILRGEDLDAPSRELRVAAHRLAEWGDALLAAGRRGLESRAGEWRDDEAAKLRAMFGELTMDNAFPEMLFERFPEAYRPPRQRSSG